MIYIVSEFTMEKYRKDFGTMPKFSITKTVELLSIMEQLP